VTITLEDNGETFLTCPVVADQAVLYGLLRKVRDLSLPLISVTRVKSGDEADGSDVEPQVAPSYLETDKQDDFN
jgi:hypothetical protein